jgi:hypothetical protein
VTGRSGAGSGVDGCPSLEVIRIGAAGAGKASRQFKECSFPGGGLVLLQGQQKAGGESAVKGEGSD